MRYDDQHKAESRKEILRSAAREFRRHGIEQVRIGDVMQAAGLTHGGFYRHFADKDHLLVEAISTALTEISEKLQQLTHGLPRRAALRKVIEYYLSEEHLRQPGSGCALAALGTELGRFPEKERRIVEQALDQYADRLDGLMPGPDKTARRAAFHVLFASMAGCLTAARVYVRPEKRRELLEAGKRFYIGAFCLAESGSREDVTL